MPPAALRGRTTAEGTGQLGGLAGRWGENREDNDKNKAITYNHYGTHADYNHYGKHTNIQATYRFEGAKAKGL